jgi:hypothetical protein
MLLSGMSSDVTPKEWTGVEPLDLTRINGKPDTKQEVKSPVDQKFDNAYTSIKSAIEKRNGDAYIKGLAELVRLMQDEVRAQYGKQPIFGDMDQTFMEWWRKCSYPAVPRELMEGKDTAILSDTLDNNGKIHHDWPGDKTMSRNSNSFGESVARYINRRGNQFISGSIVEGKSENNSPFVVQTTFKGFPQG